VNQGRSADVELLSQVEDIGFDNGVPIADKVVAPSVINDAILRENLTRIQEKQTEKIELCLREMDRSVGSPDLVTVFIDDEIGKADMEIAVLVAMKDGRDPGNEFHH